MTFTNLPHPQPFVHICFSSRTILRSCIFRSCPPPGQQIRARPQRFCNDCVCSAAVRQSSLLLKVNTGAARPLLRSLRGPGLPPRWECHLTPCSHYKDWLLSRHQICSKHVYSLIYPLNAAAAAAASQLFQAASSLHVFSEIQMSFLAAGMQETFTSLKRTNLSPLITSQNAAYCPSVHIN